MTLHERWRKFTYPIRSRLEREPTVTEIFETESPRIRVEVWSDGSVFIDGDDAVLEFARLKTDNYVDAERWLREALRALQELKP